MFYEQTLNTVLTLTLALFRMGIFRAAHRLGERGVQKGSFLPKICHTYPAMMKLGTVIPYLKKIQKIYQSRDASPGLCWHQNFFTGNHQILKYRYRLHFDIQFLILLTFSEFLNIFFNKPGYHFHDVSKNGYPRPS